jgi:hypothetical protein
MEEDIPDHSIDLDEVFSDPENDPLTFNVTEPGPFEIEIDENNRLLISPPENAFGSWNISVSASDGLHEPVETELEVTVFPVDDPPSLYNPRLDPTEGISDVMFTFSIEITDIDSGSPNSAKVMIDGDSHDLSMSSGDNASGMVLEWSGRLEPGSYSHYFTVDGVRHPETGSISGPEVLSSQLPYLEDGAVDNEEGGLGTEFQFSVTWMGPNSEEPDDMYLILDGNSISLEYFDGDPLTGSIYMTYISIEEGQHNFHFEAYLNDLDFRYPQTGEIEGPIVHAPKILECGNIRLGDKTDKADYRFFVNYEYLADEEPQEVSVLLNGREYALTESEGTPVSGMNFTREISIFEGTYGVQFRILADGIILNKDSSDLIVEMDKKEGPGDGVDSGQDDSESNKVIVIALLIAAIIAGVFGFILYSRRKRRNDLERSYKEIDEEEQWDR